MSSSDVDARAETGADSGRIVVVLGMHRGGTSAVTRGLKVLGVSLGDHFLPPQGDNEKGFWEDIDIYSLNVEMLAALESEWDYLRPIESSDVSTLVEKGYLSRGVELIRRKAATTAAFGFKDPRVTKLLPFWKVVFSRCQLRVSYVLVIRHPRSVAISLAVRDGIDIEKSYLMWLGHIITGLRGTAGDDRVLVDYDLLMESPERQLNRIAAHLDFELRPKELEYYLTEFLEAGMRHTNYDLGDLASDEACPPLAREIYTTLVAKASSDVRINEAALQNEIDRWRSEFVRLKPSLMLLDRLYEQKKAATLAIAERDERMGELSQALAQREQQIEGLNRALSDRDVETRRLNGELADRDSQILGLNFDLEALRDSTSWRLTMPVRYLGERYKTTRRLLRLLPALKQHLVNRASWRKAWRLLLDEGVAGISRALKYVERNHLAPPYDNQSGFSQVTRAATSCLRMRVLVVAEMSLPQCFKYRVKQKEEMFRLAGIDCTICDWVDAPACMNALQTHSLVIFYRVPDLGGVTALIAEAERLGIPSYWEVDDLIFDRQLLANSRNISALEEETRDGVLRGALLYKRAMLGCQAGLASTKTLAEAMRGAGVDKVSVVENALDAETMVLTREINERTERKSDSVFRIVYGSGTSTHDVDFEQAASAIVHMLEKYPDVRFRLIGKLNLPKTFLDYEEKLEVFPLCSYAEYFGLLAECDVNITPLEPTLFNDAKSNIKYLEASALRLPSVCSPAKAFVDVIEHRANGMIAESTEQWIVAFESLYKNPETAAEMGEAAYKTVQERYTVDAILRDQLVPLMEAQEPLPRSRRILMANVYFSPQSFGGATIVAEHMVKRLVEEREALVSVFTTLPDDRVPAYGLRRYEVDGAQVFAMGLPKEHDAALQFDNPKTLVAFKNVLRAVMPEVVHIHSIQGIGAAIIDACKEENIPVVVTLHDAWWICGRGFMVNHEGVSCFQREVDLGVCDTCVTDAKLNRLRQNRLHELLIRAEHLLTPSEYFRDLYAANGFPEDKIVVNRNGVLPPAGDFRTTESELLRFAYVGGNNSVKGFDILCEAFTQLGRQDYELKVVDSTESLGFSSLANWKPAFKQQLRLIPAFGQDGLDKFFAEVDVLLFPTLCRESFGLIVREALIRGVWVVTTAAGGAVEDIEDGVNGTILPLELSPELLRTEVERLLEDAKRIKAHVNPHKDEIKTVEEQADELWRVYSEHFV